MPGSARPLAEQALIALYEGRWCWALLCNSCVIRHRRAENGWDGSGSVGIAYRIEKIGRTALRDREKRSGQDCKSSYSGSIPLPASRVAPTPWGALIPGSSVGRASGC
jgi:hypothetical protein